jgi:translation initiation factor 5B
MERTKKQRETELRKTLSYPCKIKLLEGCVFRVSRPAIVGVRVLAGKLRPELKLIREDGKRVGKIKSMQSENESIKEASQGDEIAIAIEGPTVGRQINVNDILYVDITEAEAKRLLELELTPDERDVLQQLINIKRRDTPFWAM